MLARGPEGGRGGHGRAPAAAHPQAAAAAEAATAGARGVREAPLGGRVEGRVAFGRGGGDEQRDEAVAAAAAAAAPTCARTHALEPRGHGGRAEVKPKTPQPPYAAC